MVFKDKDFPDKIEKYKRKVVQVYKKTRRSLSRILSFQKKITHRSISWKDLLATQWDFSPSKRKDQQAVDQKAFLQPSGIFSFKKERPTGRWLKGFLTIQWDFSPSKRNDRQVVDQKAFLQPSGIFLLQKRMTDRPLTEKAFLQPIGIFLLQKGMNRPLTERHSYNPMGFLS